MIIKVGFVLGVGIVYFILDWIGFVFGVENIIGIIEVFKYIFICVFIFISFLVVFLIWNFLLDSI